MFNLFRAQLMKRVGVCMALILTFSWLSIPGPLTGAQAAADESAADAHTTYNELKSGQRLWKDKQYKAPEQPTVYLTFDDGPSPLTAKVLDILKEEDVKATFFVLGEQVKSHPELVRRALEEGHTIGNHTYNHVYKELYSGAQTFWDQLQQTEDIIADAAGIRPRLVRAPGGTFGNFDAFYFYYLDQAGYEVYDWNIDSGDSARPGVPASEIIQTVKKGPFKNETVVLMHDGTGHDQSVKALPEVIRLFKEKGYAFASLTTEVQPIHFSSGKIKWSRSLTEVGHEQLLAEAGEHMRGLEAAGLTKTASAAGEEEGASLAIVPKGAGKAKDEPLLPLELRLGERQLQLDAEQYRMVHGLEEVPLRPLIEAMGGQIHWDGSERTAVVRYGGYAAEYDFSRHELRLRAGGRLTAVHLPQMELIDGTVYVPLQATLQSLGCRIADSSEENGHTLVRASMSGGFVVSPLY
ncbi:polysaccharide deacetylase [Paenibacillus doosanensis]|uniref:polysaccharide deacetylase n=1 Tax=Paenibacillus doosanensis TaxID=1229154 RepID=UPI00217FD7D3|nr:polysaccharide deacetylase [Paenibacillus doosanensis]MCS7463405.1 polysaccharide deacetylase [Paenibacillus doosanensis]